MLLRSESPMALHSPKIKSRLAPWHSQDFKYTLASMKPSTMNLPIWLYMCFILDHFTHLLMWFVLFLNPRCPCYFSLSMQSLPFKPFQVHFHTEYLPCPFSPQQFLQPLTVWVTGQWTTYSECLATMLSQGLLRIFITYHVLFLGVYMQSPQLVQALFEETTHVLFLNSML